MEGRDEQTEAENVNANYISILLRRDRLTETPTKLPHILSTCSQQPQVCIIQSLWVQSSIIKQYMVSKT